ncbi:MAG: mycodextranase [Actinomycetia bacterium]|nr:mycodextranase [Actinomycetes bacterium]
MAVAGSADGSAFTTLRAAAGYAFSPSSGNTAAIGVSGSARYVRLTFTANTGWPAAQAAETEVYSAGGTTTPPPPAGNLALGAATTQSGHVQNYG